MSDGSSSKPFSFDPGVAGSGDVSRSLVQSVVPQRHGDQDRDKRAEAEHGNGKKVEEVALRIDATHRQVEGDTRLTAAALSLAIPFFLTLCFLGMYQSASAITDRDRRRAITLYLLGLAGALLAIHAAVH